MKKAEIPQIMALIDNLEHEMSMPEQQSFDKHIDPDHSSAQQIILEDQAIEDKVTRNSLFYGVIALTALFIQMKSNAYHEIKPLFSWLINFIT